MSVVGLALKSRRSGDMITAGRVLPKAELPGSEEFLWSKVKFGLKPTVRVSHVVIYPITKGRNIEYVIDPAFPRHR